MPLNSRYLPPKGHDTLAKDLNHEIAEPVGCHLENELKGKHYGMMAGASAR